MWLADEPGSRDPGSPPLEQSHPICDFLTERHLNDVQRANLLSTLASNSSYPSSSASQTSASNFLLDNNETTAFSSIQDSLGPLCFSASFLDSEDSTLANSASFLTLLEKELVPPTTFTQTFLQSILASVDSRDPVVANAWVETLLDVIDLLPKDIIKRDILTIAVTKGQISRPISSRLSCCKLLGKISTKFESYLIKNEILPVVQSLCQDVDYEVRGCMCRQLDTVAKGIGLEATKSAILPELVELANDEECYVRLAAVETVVNMLSLLDDETCTQTIIPLVKKLCKDSIQAEDVTLPIVARQLGKLCHGLSVNLTQEQQEWFLVFYRDLARLGLPVDEDYEKHEMPDILLRLDGPERHAECRQSCAYNFPAMMLFAGPSNFKAELYTTFQDLVGDPIFEVRRTIACGFHEVAKMLGPSVHLILVSLILLLRDESLEVLKGLIPNLPITLEAIARDHYVSDIEDVIAALIACEEAVGRTSNWRLQASILEKLSCLPKFLPSQQIYDIFIPIMMRKLHTARAIPCRVAAASTLLIWLRMNPKHKQRRDICQRLIRELCHGSSCHERMLFITVCTLVMEIFSKSFFKENFFSALLELAGDEIANIRLKLCSVLANLKSLLRLPEDRGLLHQLETCVGKLMASEEDRDVSAALRNAILELDNIEVAVEFPNNGTVSDDDIDDLRKEEEERNLVNFGGHKKDNVEFCRSLDRKLIRPGGRIPTRRLSSPRASPEKRQSLPTEPIPPVRNFGYADMNLFSGMSDKRQSLQISNATNGSKPHVKSVSRIPTLGRPLSYMAETTSSAARKAAFTGGPPAPGTKYPSPTSTPSPEALRRTLRSKLQSPSPARRKSLGPGAIVTSPTTPRANGSRVPSLIPRYPSSPSLLAHLRPASSPPSPNPTPTSLPSSPTSTRRRPRPIQEPYDDRHTRGRSLPSSRSSSPKRLSLSVANFPSDLDDDEEDLELDDVLQRRSLEQLQRNVAAALALVADKKQWASRIPRCVTPPMFLPNCGTAKGTSTTPPRCTTPPVFSNRRLSLVGCISVGSVGSQRGKKGASSLPSTPRCGSPVHSRAPAVGSSLEEDVENGGKPWQRGIYRSSHSVQDLTMRFNRQANAGKISRIPTFSGR